MKTKIIAIIVLCICTSAYAQNQQTIHLKDGSMVKGEIIEKITDSHVKLQTADGTFWSFKMDEIDKIDDANISCKKQINTTNKGFYNVTDLGFLSGNNSSYFTTTVSAQTVSGYMFNKNWSAGVGIGLESFYPVLAPVFAEGRYSFLQGRTSPFVAAKAGYGVPLENWKNQDEEWANKGGIMLNANVGIRHYFSSSIGLVISAGYRYQKSVSEEMYYALEDQSLSETMITTNHYNRLVLRFGLLFN